MVRGTTARVTGTLWCAARAPAIVVAPAPPTGAITPTRSGPSAPTGPWGS